MNIKNTGGITISVAGQTLQFVGSYSYSIDPQTQSTELGNGQSTQEITGETVSISVDTGTMAKADAMSLISALRSTISNKNNNVTFSCDGASFTGLYVSGINPDYKYSGLAGKYMSVSFSLSSTQSKAARALTVAIGSYTLAYIGSYSITIQEESESINNWDGSVVEKFKGITTQIQVSTGLMPMTEGRSLIVALQTAQNGHTQITATAPDGTSYNNLYVKTINPSYSHSGDSTYSNISFTLAAPRTSSGSGSL